MHPLPSPFPKFFAAATFLFAAAAFAQATPPAGTPPPPQKPASACRADAAALCPSLPPGHAERRAIFQCLESQQDKVSAPCKAEMDAMKARIEAEKEACKPDVQKFCAGVEMGGGRVMQCLKQHESELSDACKAAQKRQGPPPGAPPAQPKP